MEKINLKYLRTLERPWAKNIMENPRNGTEIVIELTPEYFSAWDFFKSSQNMSKADLHQRLNKV